MTLLSKSLGEALYPDLIEAGGLHGGITRALRSAGSSLEATTVAGFIPYARVEQGSRFIQIYAAAERRLFILEFWFEGTVYGKGSTPDVGEAAGSAHAWVLEEPKIAEMRERFSFFTPTEDGRAHEGGYLLEHRWESLLRRWKENDPYPYSPRPLIQAAMLRPELRRLFPFTSLNTLRFSRTSHPLTGGCPSAVSLGGGLYRAYSAKPKMVTRRRKGEEYQKVEPVILGEGTVEEVLDLLIDNLPPECETAVNGTAGDSSNG